ncbi:ABC transporter ATP-binding protein [Roseivivax sp. CAU 1761]
MHPVPDALQSPPGPRLPELERVSLIRDGRPLLHDLSLRLSEGGITAIMGPNGAGKSLLLRVLQGLVPPDSGRVVSPGLSPPDQALVFQKPVLLRRSVAANLDFVLPRAGRRARRAELLARVGLAGREAQPARRLSGGEQQRLALARALATAPRLLLLDEPTASLDPASARLIEALLGDVARAGTKIVLVTHDRAQAERLASEIVVLMRGRLADQGPAARVLGAPAGRDVRDFLAGRLVV